MGHEKCVDQLCFTALVHQIYVYADECLLVKSTSFGSIVRDSNTIIVRVVRPPPLPPPASLVASSVQNVVYYSFYMQIQTIASIAKLFLIRSLIAPR